MHRSSQSGLALGTILLAIVGLVFTTGLVAKLISPTVVSLAELNDSAADQRSAYVASNVVLNDISNALVASNVPLAPPPAMEPAYSYNRLPAVATPAADGTVSEAAVWGGLIPRSFSSATASNHRYCAYANVAPETMVNDVAAFSSDDDVQTYAAPVANRYSDTISQAMQKPLFALIHPGSDGMQSTTCEQAAVGNIQGDDRVNVALVGEVSRDLVKQLRENERAQYTSLFTNAPNCQNGFKLVLRDGNSDDTTLDRSSAFFDCEPEANPTALTHAVESLPQTCDYGSFLIANPDYDGNNAEPPYVCGRLDTAFLNGGTLTENVDLDLAVEIQIDEFNNVSFSGLGDGSDADGVDVQNQKIVRIATIYESRTANDSGGGSGGGGSGGGLGGTQVTKSLDGTDVNSTQVDSDSQIGFTTCTNNGMGVARVDAPTGQSNTGAGNTGGSRNTGGSGGSDGRSGCTDYTITQNKTTFVDVVFTCVSNAVLATKADLVMEFKDGTTSRIGLCSATRNEVAAELWDDRRTNDLNLADDLPYSRVPASISVALTQNTENVFIEMTAEITQPDQEVMDAIEQVKIARLGTAARPGGNTGTANGSGSNATKDAGDMGGVQNTTQANTPDTASMAPIAPITLSFGEDKSVVTSALVRE